MIGAMHTTLAAIQVATGLAIMLGGLVLSAAGVDSDSKRRTRWAIIGLVCWGAWLALRPLTGHEHDSLPGLAMSLLVAYVLLRYGRQLRGILHGETWWPPHGMGSTARFTVHMEPRRTPPPWYKKINPLWALFGNVDDGYWGDPNWMAKRSGKRSLWEAWVWWTRNPAHNLTWYVIGVADRERLMVGRWSPKFHRPGGGLLTAWTDVRVFGIWISLPFVSYLSPHAKTYIGWRPSGAFGIKVNLSWKARPEWQ